MLRSVRVVVLDVDGTLTRRDTLEDVVGAAIDGAVRRTHRHRPEADVLRRTKLEQWAQLKEAYAGPYQAFLERLLHTAPLENSYDSLMTHFLEEERVVRLIRDISDCVTHVVLTDLTPMTLNDRLIRNTSHCGGWRHHECWRASLGRSRGNWAANLPERICSDRAPPTLSDYYGHIRPPHHQRGAPMRRRRMSRSKCMRYRPTGARTSLPECWKDSSTTITCAAMRHACLPERHSFTADASPTISSSTTIALSYPLAR